MFSPFGIIHLAGLALFLSIFLGRTLYLRIRRRVSAITLDLRHKGWRGLVEVALFGWATEVVCTPFPRIGASSPRRWTCACSTAPPSRWAGPLSSPSVWPSLPRPCATWGPHGGWESTKGPPAGW